MKSSTNHNSHSQLVAGQYTYFQQDCIGKGAWGSVFKAKDSKDNLVAIKKMNKFQIQASEDSYRKLLAQIASLKKVKGSQNVIKFIDVFKTENYYYIVTEFYEDSEDLLKFMQRRKTTFPELQAIKLWRGIIKGVAFLHQNNIMHRDLKPQNIIYIPKTKQIKIIDFGLALMLQNNQAVSSLVGSPMFISPQVLRRQKYTHKSDIWSLGIIFYYMLFGCSPYGDPKSIKQIQNNMNKIKSGQFKLPNQMMSQDIRHLITACLEYDEHRRPEASELLKFRVFTQKENRFSECLKSIPRIQFDELTIRKM